LACVVRLPITPMYPTLVASAPCTAGTSNFGSWIDLAAPGVLVPTTAVHGLGDNDARVLSSGVEILANPLGGAAIGSRTGQLVDCGLGTAADFAGIAVSGRIALIQRGLKEI